MTAHPDLSRARPHDLGGQPAGPIDRAEHEAEPWQNLVTALMYLLRDQCHLAKTDEMRRAIEDMKPEEYRRLGYFDKWAVGISTLVVEKGLMTRDEIARRVGDISARLGANHETTKRIGGLPAGPIGPRGHEPEPWERLLTALLSTAGPAKAKIHCVDEFRRAREDLEPDFYNSLTYFELWTQGFINLMEEKGVLTRAEVELRAAEIKDRLKRIA